MVILQKDELKKEFSELTKDQKLSVDEAVDKLFKKIDSSDYLLSGFNGLYVYMGTYKLAHESDTTWYPVDDILVSEEDPTAEYKLFYELDTGLSKCVEIKEDLETFENANTIIYIPNVRSFEKKFTFIEDFKKLRKIYLRELCVGDEESAVALVTTEDYIKQLFSVENYMKENNIPTVFYQTFYDAALCNQNKQKTSVKKLIRKPNKKDQ